MLLLDHPLVPKVPTNRIVHTGEVTLRACLSNHHGGVSLLMVSPCGT